MSHFAHGQIGTQDARKTVRICEQLGGCMHPLGPTGNVLIGRDPSGTTATLWVAKEGLIWCPRNRVNSMIATPDPRRRFLVSK